MNILVYFIVLLITAGSVLFGVEWLQAPMTPMPASQYELRAARPPAVQQAAVKPQETTGTQQATAPLAPAAPAVAAIAPEPVAAPAPLVAPEPQPAVAAAPKCDVDACERAYRSFTASDCTYQPSDGPRRLCTKGTPPSASAPRSVRDVRAQASCNIAACTNAYISFNAGDCTYQPSDGPRRLCEK
jgi:hypothetical protein